MESAFLSSHVHTAKRKMMWLLALFLSVSTVSLAAVRECKIEGCDAYMQQRELLLNLQSSLSFDSGIVLTTEEKIGAD